MKRIRALGRMFAAVCCLLGMALASPLFAQEPNIREVEGVGRGRTSEEALVHARQNAIENAVGVYIKVETEVEQYRLKRKQILTHSNGLILKEERLSENPCEIGVEIRIRATVEMQELVKRIHDMTPGDGPDVQIQTEPPPKSVEELTEETRDREACALLANELREFDPVRQLFDIQLVRGEDLAAQGLPSANPVMVGTLPDGLVKLRIFYEIFPDRERYFTRVKSLTQVLEQISLREPQPFAPRLFPIVLDDMALAKQNANIAERQHGATEKGIHDGMLLQRSYWLEDLQYKNGQTAKQLKARAMEPNTLSVVTEMNDNLSGLRGYDYLLAEPVMALYTRWSDGYLWDDEQRNKNERALCVDYVVKLLDAEGESLAEATFPVRKIDLLFGNEASEVFDRNRGYRAARAEWVPLVRHGAKYNGADAPKELRKRQKQVMTNREYQRYAEVYRNYVEIAVPKEVAERTRRVQLRLQALDVQE